MISHNLRLIFFHGRSVFNGKQIDIKLTGKYNVTYGNNQYKVEPNPRFIDDFWQEGVTDISMIVGNNGGGKTDICNTLLEFLCSPGSGGSEDAFLLCETNNNDLKVIKRASNKYAPKVIWKSKELSYAIHDISTESSSEILKLLQCVYYKPCLDEYDYKRPIIYSNFYDASLGGLIHNARSFQYDSRPSSESQIADYRDDIVFYYSKELKEILRFFKNIKDITGNEVFPNKSNSDDDMLRYPQSLSIYVADYEGYLSLIANWKEYRINELPDVKPISEAIRRLKHEFSHECFSFNLVFNILISPLYMACPKVVPTSGDFKKEYATFCHKYISSLETEKLSANDTIHLIKWANTFMTELISPDTPRITPYIEDAISALNSIRPIMDMSLESDIYGSPNEAIFNYPALTEGNSADNNLDSLIRFMDQISRLELNYSFVSYDFALSTGEFAVWKMLSKLFNGTNNSKYLFNYVILDEPDMSLHPEWQRRFISILDWFSAILYRETKIKFQFLITTHSPIMLSDMPMDSVVYLHTPVKDSYDICNNRNFNTFGNVIYSLYNDAFFLNKNGQIGEHATNWIKRLIKELKTNDKTEPPQYFDDEQMLHFKKKIYMIGDSVLREQLLRMLYRRARINEKNIGLVDRKIQETEEYLEYLKRIKEHDTNQI